MARPVKVKAGVKLVSKDACAEALRALLLATTTEEQIVAKRDRLVAMAHARYESKLDAARMAKAQLLAALEDYYYAHIPEIEKDGHKFLQLTTGRIGRRTNPEALKPLNRSWTWKRIIDLVKVKYGNEYLRQPEPEVDREAIKAAKLAVEELKQLGLKLEADETFWAEPDRPSEAKS